MLSLYSEIVISAPLWCDWSRDNGYIMLLCYIPLLLYDLFWSLVILDSLFHKKKSKPPLYKQQALLTVDDQKIKNKEWETVTKNLVIKNSNEIVNLHWVLKWKYNQQVNKTVLHSKEEETDIRIKEGKKVNIDFATNSQIKYNPKLKFKEQNIKTSFCKPSQTYKCVGNCSDKWRNPTIKWKLISYILRVNIKTGQICTIRENLH